MSFCSAYGLINELCELQFGIDFEAAKGDGCVLNCPKMLAFPHKSSIFRMDLKQKSYRPTNPFSVTFAG